MTLCITCSPCLNTPIAKKSVFRSCKNRLWEMREYDRSLRKTTSDVFWHGSSSDATTLFRDESPHAYVHMSGCPPLTPSRPHNSPSLSLTLPLIIQERRPTMRPPAPPTRKFAHGQQGRNFGALQRQLFPLPSLFPYFIFGAMWCSTGRTNILLLD